MLSNDPQTPYQKWTGPDGKVTFQASELQGPVTVSAAASDYSSATYQQVDARNVSLRLSPVSQSPPPARDTATFEGTRSGMGRLAVPGANEFRMTVIRSTRVTPWSSIPDPGSDNVVQSDGSFTVKTRTKALTLAGIGGLYNTETETFSPSYIGVARGLDAQDGQTYQQDLELDTPLDASIRFKVSGVPSRSGVASVRYAQPYLDFGGDGVLLIRAAKSSDNLLVADALPTLDGSLSDVGIDAVVGLYTEQSGGELGLPLSVVQKRDISQTGGTISIPNLLGIPFLTLPDTSTTYS